MAEILIVRAAIFELIFAFGLWISFPDFQAIEVMPEERRKSDEFGVPCLWDSLPDQYLSKPRRRYRSPI